ncbi:transposase family protein, partial [Bacillus smithii]|uniref:transposase family protein n=1 Tax=Bacillus smithii TaxID=1479 RepID=UPI003D1F032F
MLTYHTYRAFAWWPLYLVSDLTIPHQIKGFNFAHINFTHTITHVEDQITYFEIHIQTPVKVQKCPCCQKETSSVHDYRIQKIRDVKVFEKYCFLILRKRRYRCKSCGKRFYEPYSFLERYQRHTKRLLQALLVKVREYNFKQVAKETGLGHSTVIRLFDKYYSYDNKAL